MKILKKHTEEEYQLLYANIFKSKLTLKSRGLLYTLLSLPDSFEFSEENLLNLLPDGQQRLRSALKELEQYKFLIRIPIRESNGQYSNSLWLVSNEPLELGELYNNK